MSRWVVTAFGSDFPLGTFATYGEAVEYAVSVNAVAANKGLPPTAKVTGETAE